MGGRGPFPFGRRLQSSMRSVLVSVHLGEEPSARLASPPVPDQEAGAAPAPGASTNAPRRQQRAGRALWAVVKPNKVDNLGTGGLHQNEHRRAESCQRSMLMPNTETHVSVN